MEVGVVEVLGVSTVHDECKSAERARKRKREAAVWSAKPIREEHRKRLQKEGRWEEFQEEYLGRVELEGSDEDLRIWDELVESYVPKKFEELPLEAKMELELSERERKRDPGAVVVDPDKTHGNKARALRAVKKREAAKKKKKGRVDIREVVEWVFAHIGEAGVKKEDEPCAGAYQLLQRVESGVKMQDWFYSQMFVKLLPTRAQVEGDDRFRDTGQSVMDFIDRIVITHGVDLGEEEA